MVLLNPIIEVGALPDANGFQITSRSFLEPVYGIPGQDRFAIGLTAVDDNPLGPAMALESLAEEALGCSDITSLAEPELDSVAIAVDRDTSNVRGL
jgi:hypothetical protein